jgi:hypothetical protein
MIAGTPGPPSASYLKAADLPSAWHRKTKIGFEIDTERHGSAAAQDVADIAVADRRRLHCPYFRGVALRDNLQRTDAIPADLPEQIKTGS